jgi:choline/glycine/proline betaine transport protein
MPRPKKDRELFRILIFHKVHFLITVQPRNPAVTRDITPVVRVRAESCLEGGWGIRQSEAVIQSFDQEGDMSDPDTNSQSGNGLGPGPEEQLLFGEPDPVELHLPEKLHIGESDSDDAITQKLQRQGVRIGKGMIAPRVFWPALIIIVGIVVFSVALPEGTGNVISNIQNWIVTQLGWYYMLVVGLFVGFAIIVGFSKFGKIKLGKDDDEPEFGVMSWFAMLFAAGMGIGLVFYGVAEPLTYATTGPKPGWPGGEVENAQMGMAQTFVHWGLHPWALYAVLGMALAYAIHRRGRPLSIRWALETAARQQGQRLGR